MKIQVFRPLLSSYHHQSFASSEAHQISALSSEISFKRDEKLLNADPVILISNTHLSLRDLSPETLRKTQIIIHANSGFDNLDQNLLEKYKIPVIKGNQIRCHAVVEYILAALFQSQNRSLKDQQSWEHLRQWNRNLLNSQTTLIIGLGQVGRLLYDTLKYLCPNLHTLDPYQKDSDFKSLHELQLKQYQNIILTCALNNSTYHMVNQKFLELCQNDVTLINPARGKIYQQKHLWDFLSKNPKAIAYLDVYPEEPFDFSKLNKIKNIIKTSHIAGVSNQLDQATIDFEVYIIGEFIKYFPNNLNDFFQIHHNIILNYHKDLIYESN